MKNEKPEITTESKSPPPGQGPFLPSPQPRRVWVIRAGKESEAHEQFLRHNLIGLGWNRLGDLAEVKGVEEIKQRMRSEYPDQRDGYYNTCSGEVMTLVRRMNVGDVVLYPVRQSDEVVLGLIDGDYRHSPEEIFAISRRVKWLRSSTRSQLPAEVRKSLKATSGCFEISNPGASFRMVLEESEMFADLARSFVGQQTADNETGEKIRKHREQHKARHHRWTSFLSEPTVGREDLLAALKDMDWYGGAKKITAPGATATQEKSDEHLRAFRALAEAKPSSPQELKSAVADLPKGFSLGFASEFLTYVHPGTFWELNFPVYEALKLLKFKGWDALPHGKKNDYEKYFALRPLIEGLRSALQFSGIPEADYLDVDLLLWEIARQPDNFPGLPVRIDEEVLDGLIEDLRARHPGFESFDEQGSSWWLDETGYKLDLLELFRSLFGEGDELSGLSSGELMQRFIELLTMPLASTGAPQNLVSWRPANVLKTVAADNEAAEAYGSAIRSLLFGPGRSPDRVEQFNDVTWPLIRDLPRSTKAHTRSLPTLLLMLKSPDEEILIRTTEFSEAVQALTGKNAFSDGPMTAVEYRRAQVFASGLFSALEARGLGPQSMIDVQGFLHVTAARNTWIFQANPKGFDVVGFLRDGHTRLAWSLPQNADRVREGDEAYIWVSGPDRGIVAYGTLASDAIDSEDVPPEVDDAERPYDRDPSIGPGSARVVLVDLPRAFPESRILGADLKEDEILRDLTILKQPVGTVFSVPRRLAYPLRRRLPVNGSMDVERGNDFAAILKKLDSEGLYFPDELVANYLLALQTKRFVILTGISGTGKTRLAQAVAKHFALRRRTLKAAPSSDDSVVVTVRPYMLKYKRFVIPAALTEFGEWEAAEGSKSMGRMMVEYEGGVIEQSFYRAPNRNVTILLFSKELREWFLGSFGIDDQFNLELVTTEDSEVSGLRISRTTKTMVEETVANQTVVAVRPDWTDHRGLLGYHNPLTGQYVRTPFLDLVMQANEENELAQSEGREPQPFFAILDEMNLARVEHYFSDLLSCMESGEAIHLHDDAAIDAGETEYGIPVPRNLPLPENLFVTGTVNVDETTYMFSPKVLDRAFTLELNDVDLAGYARKGSAAQHPAQQNILSAFKGLSGRWLKPEKSDWIDLGLLAGGRLQERLVRVNHLLEAEGRHFGYRVANEIARFVCLASEQTDGDEEMIEAAFDLAVLEKILPKLNGTQQELHGVLRRLFGFALNPEGEGEGDPGQWALRRGTVEWISTDDSGETGTPSVALPRTAHKLLRMVQRLRQRGFVSYIE